MRPSLMAWGIVLCGLLACGAAEARTLKVGPGQTYAKPSEAAAAATDGDQVLIAPGQYFDCAVWRQNRLVVEGASEDGTVITDKTCQGKALFVISGSDVTIRNLTLARARVPDGNGAGIRSEGRNLTVDHVHFDNNQDGILTSPQPDGTLLVRNSNFTRNGTCEASCSHGIYAGEIALLRVENSTFRETHVGHHIKSRAMRTEVVGCDIADGTAGTASYTIDVPNGGSLLVQDTKMEKGANAQNHAGISIGEEGVDRPTPEITIAGNSFRNDGDYQATFVVNVTATPATLRTNKLSGGVTPLRGDGTIDGR